MDLPTLAALADRLIPPDDLPGAVEAGALTYLLAQFEGDLADQVGLYAQGLQALVQESIHATGRPFRELAAADQDALLTRIAQGVVQVEWPVDPVAFVAMAAEHIAEGFYSDPGNRGNQGMIAWQMVGFQVSDYQPR
jgi:gluconate 2-dehydrogenase gamma chain